MILKLAWKNIWRNRRRTFITISAIGFAVLFAASGEFMRAGLSEKMVESIVKDNMGYIQVQNKDFWDDQTLDNGFYADEVPIAEIEALEEVVEVKKKLESGTLSSTGLNTRGTFIISYNQDQGLPKQITNNITTGAFPKEGAQEILMGEELAEYLGLGLGDTVVFFGMGYQGSTAAGLYTLSGLIDMHMPELNRMVAYMTMPDLQEFISAPGLVTALTIVIDDPGKLNKTRDKIQAIVGDEYKVMTWEEMNPELKQMLASNEAEGAIMRFILYMIITFVMFGTILMATQERKYELGVLMAIGMKKWKAQLMVLFETLFIGLLGALVGIVMAMSIAYYFHYNPIELGGEIAEIYEAYGFEPIIPFSVNPRIALSHAIIVSTISMVLVFYPINVIRKMKPVQAMKM